MKKRLEKSGTSSSRYPTLPEALSSSLCDFISCTKSPSSSKTHSATQTISFLLLLGCFEDRCESSSIDAGSLYPGCLSLSSEIITVISELHGGINSSDFFKKYKSLWAVLNRQDSKWLRVKLAKGELTAKQLVDMKPEDLESEKEKQRKKEVEERFIKESLLISEPEEIVIKTSKGEEVLSRKTETHDSQDDTEETNGDETKPDETKDKETEVNGQKEERKEQQDA